MVIDTKENILNSIKRIEKLYSIALSRLDFNDIKIFKEKLKSLYSTLSIIYNKKSF